MMNLTLTDLTNPNFSPFCRPEEQLVQSCQLTLPVLSDAQNAELDAKQKANPERFLTPRRERSLENRQHLQAQFPSKRDYSYGADGVSRRIS